MSTRNLIALSLTLMSLALLYPGLTQPMLSIRIGADLPILGQTTFYEQTQSILQTVRTLYENNNRWVAILIFFFSVVVPFAKGFIILLVLPLKNVQSRNMWYRWVAAIGKWSMADVFVVGVFIAFLSTHSNTAINAQLLSGFYYFSAYCLLSLFAIQLVDIKKG